MRTRTAIILVIIALGVLGAGWYYLLPPAGVTAPGAETSGTLAFPGLAPKLGTAARVAITSKGQTLVIARAGDLWGLADHGTYRVQQDKLRELLTGLTELRLTEARTSDPALLERLGVSDPASAASTATLVRVLDGSDKVLAELIVGHRRVRTQGNLPEAIYVRRPGEGQAWLAEGRLPVDADPQLWFDRDIANIDSKRVASVVVHRGDAVLEFGREGDKPVLKLPAAHPKLDEVPAGGRLPLAGEPDAHRREAGRAGAGRADRHGGDHADRWHGGGRDGVRDGEGGCQGGEGHLGAVRGARRVRRGEEAGGAGEWLGLSGGVLEGKIVCPGAG